jgi:general secretion pathway protein C
VLNVKTDILSQRNIMYLNIVLLAVLCIATIFLMREVISYSFEKGRPIKQTAASSMPRRDTKPTILPVDYAPVMKNNPFGFPGGEIKTLSGSAGGGMQQTDITLIGTVVGPRALSYAVFKDRSGMQEVFKIGESVFGIGSLHTVGRDKVTIMKGASPVHLSLDDVKIREIQKPGAQSNPNSPLFARKVGSGSYVVDQARLQQAINNPGQMMTDARLKPNITNGREEGFLLSEVRPGGIYHSLGLQDGDVLLRINEYDISNPERALQAFTAL